MSYAITMCGVPIPEVDARNLVTSLAADDTPQALGLANRITTCLEMNVGAIPLDAQERSTLLAVLDDPPAGLVEIRGALAREHHV